eukprot:COSAG02_NODE_6630_length_3449_cov_7.618209_2_plen_88_part_00
MPAAKEPSRLIGVRLTHPSWKDGGVDVELYIEYSDEEQFSSWKKELDRAVARSPGTRGAGHLGWRKNNSSDVSSGSTDNAQSKGSRK